jgi:hypothetical protein
MTDFTPAIDAALKSNRLKDAEFVRLVIQNPNILNTSTNTYSTGTATTYCFSTSFQPEVITDQNNDSSNVSGTYTPLGNLLAISGHQRDISATSYDTQISLVGIDPNKINLVLQVGLDPVTMTYTGGIKGSQIQIWRGFYDDAYKLIDTPQLRYTGIVTSYRIAEDRQGISDTFVLTLQCSSFKTVLENRTPGRHTNGASWNKNIPPNYDANGVPQNAAYDTGMDRIQAIHGLTFNFGMPYSSSNSGGGGGGYTGSNSGGTPQRQR